MRRSLICAVVMMALCAAGLQAQTKDKKPADKDLMVGKVVKVDMAKGTITVTLKSGKTQELMVKKETKILGPRGGVSRARLKDDRLKAGAEIKFKLGSDKKTAEEIRLPIRARKPKPKDK